jgi:hypothetical protein
MTAIVPSASLMVGQTHIPPVINPISLSVTFSWIEKPFGAGLGAVRRW